MDFDEICVLLEVVKNTNPNLYPKLKTIHDAAMARLEEISTEPVEEKAESEVEASNGRRL